MTNPTTPKRNPTKNNTADLAVQSETVKKFSKIANPYRKKTPPVPAEPSSAPTPARQQNGDYYAPGTAKNMFSRFWNALLKEERFTGMQTPDWYKGLCGDIERKALNNAQGRGVVGNDRVKGAIRANSMVKVVMETLKNSTVSNAAENFTKW